MEKASEHEKMSEMFNNFKNKLITENCFHINYGAKRHVVMPGVLQNKVNIEEVVISFMRDRTFEEEFFFVIESKEFNEKTGCKDKILIPVDDIDEIEHTEGLKFEVHYQIEIAASTVSTKKVKSAVGEAIMRDIGGVLAKIKKKDAPAVDEEPATKKIDKTEIFESKHVKSIIETFNNVLNLIESQEKELNEFINAPHGSDSDDDVEEKVKIVNK